MRRLSALALTGALLGGLAAAPARAADEPALPHQAWSFSGPFGTYDRASAQRGYQVYKEVCAACHSMRLMSFRNLAGIGFNPDEIKALAASVDVSGGLDDNGQPITRHGLPSDYFPSPFPNDKAARAANNGALPPDQSDLVKAREGGADYVYALLTGYKDAPPGFKVADGSYYNEWFPGHQIHMPQPLHDDQVTYADGTKATMEQEARDVATFLTYVSNPEMESRKRLGVKIVLFLALMTGVTYAVKRKIWADVSH
ncbi:MAG TPA: cytochrome c1 [Acetobacteraceae bacterium]|nr:cytochrome c1 [Acetobacteraceae bacterium]